MVYKIKDGAPIWSLTVNGDAEVTGSCLRGVSEGVVRACEGLGHHCARLQSL